MAEYCANADLVKIRPDILSLGVTDWADQITEAGLIIDRAMESRWYRSVAKEYNIDPRATPFERDLLLTSTEQLTRLGSYKTLELAYLFLMKNRADDAFEKERDLFRKMYRDELEEVLITGVDYDWDEDDEIASSEKNQPQIRWLMRA